MNRYETLVDKGVKISGLAEILWVYASKEFHAETDDDDASNLSMAYECLATLAYGLAKEIMAIQSSVDMNDETPSNSTCTVSKNSL